MAGKSTFLRQNALIALLAQIGSLRAGDARADRHRRPAVLARRRRRRSGARPLHLHGRDGRDRGDPQSGRRALARDPRRDRPRAPRPSTGCRSPGPRSSICTRVNRCRALFATHYHELTALSAKLPRLFNATVRVKEWQGDVVFLHEVLPGAADRSYGIQVAKLAGLPPRGDRARQIGAGETRGAGPRPEPRARWSTTCRCSRCPRAPRRKPRCNKRGAAADRGLEGAASRRDVAARGAGGAVCAEGETAEVVIAVARQASGGQAPKIKPRSPKAARRWPFCCQVDRPRTGYAARRTSFNATLSFAFRFLTR